MCWLVHAALNIPIEARPAAAQCPRWCLSVRVLPLRDVKGLPVGQITLQQAAPGQAAASPWAQVGIAKPSLLQAQAQSEEERAGLQAQLELTSQDMERAQQRLLTLEATPTPRPAPVSPQAVTAWLSPPLCKSGSPACNDSAASVEPA